MSNISTYYILHKQYRKQNAHQRKKQHHHIAAEGGQCTHACHRQAGIVDQGLQHYGRQSRQHTHHHRKQQYKTVLTQMTQTPTVDFAIKTHLFFKKLRCKDTKNN